MVASQLVKTVLALPEGDRLDLARRIIASIGTQAEVDDLVNQGIKRIEDVVEGRVAGLTEEQFRQALA